MKRNKSLTVVAVVLLIIAVLIFLLPFIINAVSSFNHSSSIGIIGGADGPTSIIVTSAPYAWIFPALTVIVPVALIVISVYLLKKSKQ